MELLKLAIRYFMTVTNRTCTDFYSDIENIVTEPVDNQTGIIWLKHKLLEQVINNGCSLEDIILNKAAMLSYFGSTLSVAVQEYNASVVWGKEVANIVLQNSIITDDILIWDINANLDTLVCKLGVNKNNVFLSHFNESVVSNLDTKYGTVFQYDFTGIDELDNLPETLKNGILSNKPILFLGCLPQKKKNESIKSNVSDLMYEDGFTVEQDNIYYQYLYKLLYLIKTYTLTNCRIGFFGDTALFTDKTHENFLNNFQNYFEFITGFCFSLKDFGVILDDISGMHFSLWKQQASPAINPILLVKKRLLGKTTIENGETILYETNRETLLNWLAPQDVMFYRNVPVMVNYATFKGKEIFDRTAKQGGKLATNALGTMTISNNMADIDKVMLLSSVPSSKNFVEITEDNFWKCVAAFAFVRLVVPTWNNNKKNISAPNVKIKGYEKWVHNAILMFLFDKKSMFSTIRNIRFDGGWNTVENKMFLLDIASVKSCCDNDDFLMELLNVETLDNNFIISCIIESMKDWDSVTKQLFEFCMDFIQRTFRKRKDISYACGTDAWSAGFIQIKEAFAESDSLFKANFDKLYTRYMDYLRSDISNFGFLNDN